MRKEQRYARMCRCFILFGLSCLAAACGHEIYAPGAPIIVDDMVLRNYIVEQQQPLQVPLEKRHPIMLISGMGGFQKLTPSWEYFYGVIHAIRAEGYWIFVTQTKPFQTTRYRARQLAIQVDAVLERTGAEKVHLLAHSQGGLDGRYLISSLGYGDKVATLITIGTPHHGVKAADMILSHLSKRKAHKIAFLVNSFAYAFGAGPSDIEGQLRTLTQSYMEGVFNKENQDDPRVDYYSFSGQTQTNFFVNRHKVDVANPILQVTYRVIKRTDGANDGIVSTDSARWGTHLGILPADHWDEVGQLPGAPHWSFHHLPFYRALAHFLIDHHPPPLY